MGFFGLAVRAAWFASISLVVVVVSVVAVPNPAGAKPVDVGLADGVVSDAPNDGQRGHGLGGLSGAAPGDGTDRSAEPAAGAAGFTYDPAADFVAPRLGGLDDLAQRRAALGAAPAGPEPRPTLSRLDVDGLDSFYGTSGHGRDVTLTVNPISRTHAETDVLQQLATSGGAKGSRATLYLDHPGGMCGACGRSGAVRSMARQAGISELTVVWPGGQTVIVP